MAAKHQGQTEEQALMANIERNRQFILEHSPQIPAPGTIFNTLRNALANSPLKLTSMAALTGIIAAVFLRNSTKKSPPSIVKRKIISYLISLFTHKTGNSPRRSKKEQSDTSAPLERRIVETIRQLFK